MLNYLLENENNDLLEITESYSILNEYRMSDSIINKEKLKDEEYVERQIKNIKSGKVPVTVKEAIVYITFVASSFMLFNPLYVIFLNVIITTIIAGGTSIEDQDEKSKDRMLKSIDSAIKKLEKANPKNKDDEKKLKDELKKLKHNRELVKQKL